MNNTLYVISVISNPVRYARRFELYRQFERHMRTSGAYLITVECAHGDRQFHVTQSDNPNHIQLRSSEELWQKEAMINVGISRLPHDWQYVAWVDADIEFVRKDWVHETLAQLEHYSVVHMFNQCIDLGPKLETMQVHNGFGWSYHQNGMSAPARNGYGTYGFWHPGYAWAARRDAIEGCGGLMDFPILGSADHHMALAMLGLVERTVPNGIHPNYIFMLEQWEQRALRSINHSIGYIDSPILHYFHGKKKDRRYVERWDILTKNKFDPMSDISRDYQGLWKLHTNERRLIRLRDEIKAYFRSRNEDSNDLD